MPIKTLDHYSIRTVDIEATSTFYSDVVGLNVGPRPNFPFPGAWLYHGDKAVVHVVGIDKNDPSGLEEYLGGKVDPATIDTDGSGSLDHIAFTASDFSGMKAHFESRHLKFRERQVPGMNLSQLFVTDPNGIVIELNFPGGA